MARKITEREIEELEAEVAIGREGEHFDLETAKIAYCTGQITIEEFEDQVEKILKGEWQSSPFRRPRMETTYS